MSSTPRTQLTRRDFLEAGQDLLREQGIAGVKLRALLDRLRVTTGSFYHHFADIGAYLDALADHYGDDNVQRVIEAAGALPAAERLVALQQMAAEWDIPRLDRAMRIWATTSERAAAAVARLDAALLTLMREALVDLGFDEREAQVRALLAYSAGAGQSLVISPWEGEADDTALALRIVMTPLSR